MENTNISFPSEYYDQKHVHELVGSTVVAGNCNECHNHRFATVSDEAMQEGKSHVHKVTFSTDFGDRHYHEFCGKTGPAIYVGDGKHVHFIKDCSESEDGHKHFFQAATLIDSPIDTNRRQERDCDCDCNGC